jgi:tRNA(fMet)-specific endonuclease VapC
VLFLLDTDVAPLVLREHERVSARLAAASRYHVALSLITRLEMLRGRIEAVLKSATAEELIRATLGLERSEAFLGEFRIVTIDAAAAARFESFRAIKKLNKMDRGDLLQAAVALANGATLVTRNTKDYANVTGLKLENWAE